MSYLATQVKYVAIVDMDFSMLATNDFAKPHSVPTKVAKNETGYFYWFGVDDMGMFGLEDMNMFGFGDSGSFGFTYAGMFESLYNDPFTDLLYGFAG